MNNIRDLQLVCLEILKEIDRVCKKNNIRYWLEGGTMLGAVRHKGFIPWDDDLDIAMFREDYDRFLQIAPSELKSDYFLQCDATDPENPFLYAKVRKNNTYIKEEKVRKIKMHQGIFVDVFPVDKMPNTLKKIEHHRKKIIFFRNYYDSHTDIDCNKGSFLKSAVMFLLRILPVSGAKQKRKLNQLYQKYNGNENPTYFSSWTAFHKNNFLYKKEWLDEFIEVPFEDSLFPIPAAYDALLTNMYGDYMTPPPENKRRQHGSTFSVNTKEEKHEQ